VTNADQTALKAQTSNIATTLTTHVQSSCTANSKAVVNVNAVTKSANGDLQVTYTCSGVSDHTTCQNSLDTAAKGTEIQQTVSKCSQSSNTNSGTIQKPTAAAAAAAATQKPTAAAATQKPTAAAATQKPETQAPITAQKAAVTIQALVQSSTDNKNTPCVASHTCSSTDSKTVQGTITVTNADHTALTAQTNTIANALTAHVQSSCTANSKAVVNVSAVTKSANGDLQVAYTCSGVSDHTTCQNSLNTAVQSDTIKQTVGQCSKSDNTGSTASQKATTGQAAPPSTQKPPAQALSTSSASKPTGSVTSHTCSSTDSKTVQGTITVAGCDQPTLASQTAAISSALTSQAQASHPLNSQCQVNVNTVTKAANGVLQVAYTCSGVSDHPSCLDSLHTACGSDAIKQSLSKCSQSDNSQSQSTQKTTAAAVTGKTVVQTSGKKMSILIFVLLSYRIQIQ
jgi:hypothetical protein